MPLLVLHTLGRPGGAKVLRATLQTNTNTKRKINRQMQRQKDKDNDRCPSDLIQSMSARKVPRATLETNTIDYDNDNEKDKDNYDDRCTIGATYSG